MKSTPTLSVASGPGFRATRNRGKRLPDLWRSHYGLRTARPDVRRGITWLGICRTIAEKPNYMRHFLSLMITGSAALIGNCTSAQEFHLSAGYNGSNVQKAGDERWIGRGGYMFGADMKLGHHWFLEPGIHFMVRNLGFTYATAADIPPQDFTYTERSLRVPLMLGLNLLDPAEEPAVNVSLMGGPTALIGLSSKLDQNSLDVETRGTQWYLGFAGEVQLGVLFVNAGYDVAMSDVFDGERFATNPRVNFYHASAGVRLVLAK